MALADKTWPRLRVAASWIVVLVPLGWGVVQSVVKSLPLFRTAPVAASHAAARP
jgi:hypothetical protein